jgi:hypothetical protein
MPQSELQPTTGVKQKRLGPRTVPIEHLLPHPLNANVMSEDLREKLRAHIKRTGRYPFVVVRPHPEDPGNWLGSALIFGEKDLHVVILRLDLTDSLVVALKEPIQAIQVQRRWVLWVQLLPGIASVIATGFALKISRESFKRARSESQDYINEARVLNASTTLIKIHNGTIQELLSKLGKTSKEQQARRDLEVAFRQEFLRPLNIVTWTPSFTNKKVQKAWE